MQVYGIEIKYSEKKEKKRLKVVELSRMKRDEKNVRIVKNKTLLFMAKTTTCLPFICNNNHIFVECIVLDFSY